MQNINTAAYSGKFYNKKVISKNKKTYKIPSDIKKVMSRMFSSKKKESETSKLEKTKISRTGIGKSIFSMPLGQVKKIVNSPAKKFKKVTSEIDKNASDKLDEEIKSYTSFDELEEDFKRELEKTNKKNELYAEENKLKVAQKEAELYTRELEQIDENILAIKPASFNQKFTDVYSNSKETSDSFPKHEVKSVKNAKHAKRISKRKVAGLLASLTLFGAVASSRDSADVTGISSQNKITTVVSDLGMDMSNPFVTSFDALTVDAAQDSDVNVGSIITVTSSAPIYASAYDASQEVFKMVPVYSGEQTVVSISLKDLNGNIITCSDSDSYLDALAAGCKPVAYAVNAADALEDGVVTGYYNATDVTPVLGRSR